MEMRPPCGCHPCEHYSVAPPDISTYDVVVLAAYGVGRAGVAAADTDGVDAGALKADLASDAADVKSKETKENGNGALVGLQDRFSYEYRNPFGQEHKPHAWSCSIGQTRCCSHRDGEG